VVVRPQRRQISNPIEKGSGPSVACGERQAIMGRKRPGDAHSGKKKRGDDESKRGRRKGKFGREES